MFVVLFCVCLFVCLFCFALLCFDKNGQYIANNETEIIVTKVTIFVEKSRYIGLVFVFSFFKLAKNPQFFKRIGEQF